MERPVYNGVKGSISRRSGGRSINEEGIDNYRVGLSLKLDFHLVNRDKRSLEGFSIIGRQLRKPVLSFHAFKFGRSRKKGSFSFRLDLVGTLTRGCRISIR